MGDIAHLIKQANKLEQDTQLSELEHDKQINELERELCELSCYRGYMYIGNEKIAYVTGFRQGLAQAQEIYNK